jgi:hypothetical protein
MSRSVPDIAARVRRLSAGQLRQALAYVETLERAAQGAALPAFAGSMPPDDQAAMAPPSQQRCAWRRARTSFGATTRGAK